MGGIGQLPLCPGPQLGWFVGGGLGSSKAPCGRASLQHAAGLPGRGSYETDKPSRCARPGPDVTGHHFGSAVLSEAAPRSHVSREEERDGERQVLGQAGRRARRLLWGRPVCWAQVPWCFTRGFSWPGSTRGSLFAGVDARGCWWECSSDFPGNPGPAPALRGTALQVQTLRVPLPQEHVNPPTPLVTTGKGIHFQDLSPTHIQGAALGCFQGHDLNIVAR